MARVNENIFYPQGSLFIRRTRGTKKWEVVSGKPVGKGVDRELTEVKVLKAEIDSGKEARNQADLIIAALKKEAEELAELEAEIEEEVA